MFYILLTVPPLILATAAFYFDFKTTNIPNKIPLSIFLYGVFINTLYSLINNNPIYIISSLVTGIVFFIISYALFLKQSWQGGDSKLFAALGFVAYPWASVFLVMIILNTVIFKIFLKLFNKKSSIYSHVLLLSFIFSLIF